MGNWLRTLHKNDIFWYIWQSTKSSEVFVMLSLRWGRFGRGRFLLKFTIFNLLELAARRRYDCWHEWLPLEWLEPIFITYRIRSARDFLIKTWWELDDPRWSRTGFLGTNFVFFWRFYGWNQNFCECFTFQVVQRKRWAQGMTWGWCCRSPETAVTVGVERWRSWMRSK